MNGIDDNQSTNEKSNNCSHCSESTKGISMEFGTDIANNFFPAFDASYFLFTSMQINGLNENWLRCKCSTIAVLVFISCRLRSF